MIKKLVSHLGEYKRAAVLTPLFAALEAVMDVLLPTIMAFIIDQGIEKGDIIIKVNGADAHQSSDVSAAKAKLEIGDTIDFTVWRDGKTFDVSVELMDGAEISDG